MGCRGAGMHRCAGVQGCRGAGVQGCRGAESGTIMKFREQSHIELFANSPTQENLVRKERIVMNFIVWRPATSGSTAATSLCCPPCWVTGSRQRESSGSSRAHSERGPGYCPSSPAARESAAAAAWIPRSVAGHRQPADPARSPSGARCSRCGWACGTGGPAGT
jgi:hypothetical protein